MNIFRKVTRETLKKNRTRTIVTIIGIILSTAMFTAVTTSISSVRSYMIECCIYQKGDWHGRYLNLPSGEAEDFVNNPEVESAALAQNIGYADVGSQNEYKPYLFVMGADDLFLDRMPVHLTEGRLPDNSNEIILPTHLFSNGCVEHHIGDTLTLQLGDRYYGDEKLDQGTGYWPEEEDSPGETLIIRETRTYTVTGFMNGLILRIMKYPATLPLPCGTAAGLRKRWQLISAWFIPEPPVNLSMGWRVRLPGIPLCFVMKDLLVRKRCRICSIPWLPF